MKQKMKRFENQFDQFSYSNQQLKFTLGTLTVVFLSVFLIVISTFTQISVNKYCMPSYLLKLIGLDSMSTCFYKYIPQIPVILFIATLLGRKFGTISVILYIIAGLFFVPIFALGGGIHYIFEYPFGFILAYIPAVIISGGLLDKEFSLKNILKATIFGVLIIHIIGILYLIIILFLKSEPLCYVLNWITIPSGIKIVYDLVFGLISILIGRLVKKILWLAMG